MGNREKKKIEEKNKGLSVGQWKILMQEIRKRVREKEPGCKHKRTFWYYEPYPMLLCKKCYVILKERKIKWNDVGYGFRNRTKNGRKAK